MTGTNGSTPAGIYVRISSDPEATRLGVQRQEQDCREYVESHGWTLAKVYEDNDLSAYSGKVRPAYRQLLEDIRAGTIKVVVAWHPDRMHRHPRDLEEFIEVVEGAGAHVETVKAGHLDFSTPSGRMVARLLGATARYESEHKSDRARRKHQELALAGKDVGSGRAFGYEEDRKTIRRSEAALIREAAKRALGGEAIRSICRDWTARGVPTVRGGVWSAVVLSKVLASARISGRRDYIGHTLRRRYGSKITCDKAEWPGIISPAESDRLRALFGDPARRKNTYAREYLLTGGIARCGLCGKGLVSRPRGDKRRSMVCASGPGYHGCGKIRTLADPIEELIAEAVLLAVDGGALATAMAHQDDHEASEGLLTLEAKLGELARDWAEDRITRTEWEAARGALEGRRASLQRRVDAGRRAHDLDGIPEPLRAAWPTLPLVKRRAIIQALIEAVVVAPAVKGRNFFEPDRVTVRWKV